MFKIENIGLRALQLSDAEEICRWMNDPETVAYLGYGFLRARTPEDVTEEIRLRLDGEFTGETLVIEDSLTHRYLGQINLLLPDERAKTAEISIVLLPRARGQGIAFRALGQFLDLAFHQWNYQRLYLKCLRENRKAVRLYERLGFRLEGVLRRHMLTSQGLMDVLLYGLLREEYDQIQQNH